MKRSEMRNPPLANRELVNELNKRNGAQRNEESPKV
jgi:hypothetical protein